MKILIVGAGLAGALLAGLLGKRGHEVDVVERSGDPRKVKVAEGRSINLALSQRGRTALRLLDLEEEVIQHCIPMHGRLIHDDIGRLSHIPYGARGEAILSVGRKELNVALINRSEMCEKVSFKFETTLTELHLPNQQGRPHVALMKPDGCLESRQDYDLVVGADGTFSRVRRALEHKHGVNFSQSWLGHAYKELTIPPAPDGRYAMPPNALHIWPKGTHMMIALPNPDKSFTVTLFMPLDELKHITTDGQVLQLFRDQFPDAIPLMPTLLEDFHIHPIGHLCSIRTDPWSWLGCCTLVGDAAHAIVPFYGQGMNAALEDCTVLDSMLEAYHDDIPKALLEYSRARIKEANAISDLSHANYEEMRSSVNSTWFRLRRALELYLHRLMPTTFIPLYTMVAFTNIPYSEAIERARKQDRWLDLILTALPASALALIVAPVGCSLVSRL